MGRVDGVEVWRFCTSSSKVYVLYAVDLPSSPGRRLLDGVEVARMSSLFGAAGPAICVCFDELKNRRAPRSRPGHGPEVGPPVRLIFGDVAGLRNGGARTPLHHFGDGTTARGRRSPGAVATAKGASPRSLIDGAFRAGRVEVASDLRAAATCFPTSRF